MTDLNGDGSSFGDAYVGNSDRWPGAGRNSGRLPWAKTFDVSVQYEFSLGSGHLEFRADVFNILNAQNLSGYSNNATQSNQIQVGAAEAGIVQKNAGAPRQFQFGLRYLANYANEAAYREDTRRQSNGEIFRDILSKCMTTRTHRDWCAGIGRATNAWKNA